MDNTKLEILDLMPHRDPFLFVDAIVDATSEKIITKYIFTGDECFFPGHFPEYKVVPGVILIETMAQAGGAGLGRLGIVKKGSIFFLCTIDKVKFRRPVLPGEEIRCEIVNLRASSRMIKQQGKVYVGEELAAEAEWMCLVKEGE